MRVVIIVFTRLHPFIVITDSSVKERDDYRNNMRYKRMENLGCQFKTITWMCCKEYYCNTNLKKRKYFFKNTLVTADYENK